jgi:hypothetical protein
MANKHTKRSTYSSHNQKPFYAFSQKATVKANKKLQDQSLVDMLKTIINKTN